MDSRLTTLVYLDVKEEVLRSGYGEEIAWQASRRLHTLSEAAVLREAGWVILSAGLSVRAVDKVFPEVSSAYYNWDVEALLRQDVGATERRALRSFRHPGKIRAITSFCISLHLMGTAALFDALGEEGPEYLTRFDFFGPATARHLAKNLGVQVAKPDRHLVRIARRLGWRSPQEMCAAVSDRTGDPIAVVDLVLWRFAAMHRGYLDDVGHSLERWSRTQFPKNH